MNERIEELFGKALDQAVPETWTTLNPAQLSKLKDKFAELIIRECMALCIKVENDVELSDYEGGFKDGTLLCYQEIQEHFGVE